MSRASVIKLGGELLDDKHRAELDAITAGARELVDAGHHLVFVHGGGPQTTALQRALGQEPRIVGGRRVTDDAALEAIEMVVGGRLNIELCARLTAAGIAAFGLHGASGRAIQAVKRPPRPIAGAGPDPVDLGHVGDVTGVNSELIGVLLDRGYTPVLACIGADSAGRVYNINADVVASAIAARLPAQRLVLITGTPGVLRELADPTSRIERITPAEARRAIEDGTVKGGMIPKLEESIEALARGVREVQIIGNLGPGDLARALYSPGSVGTTVLPDT